MEPTSFRVTDELRTGDRVDLFWIVYRDDKWTGWSPRKVSDDLLPRR